MTNPIAKAVALLPELKYRNDRRLPQVGVRETGTFVVSQYEIETIIAALKEMPALLDEIEGLREALKACDAHVQRHHNSGSWWNDPVVYHLKMEIIEPALQTTKPAAISGHGQ